jgi:alkyl sulfatase BDS1-like metallo-beta-lactamase superfamily hydrolase
MPTRREVIGTIPAAGAAFAMAGAFAIEGTAVRAQPAAPLAGHFHPKGKAPSPHTVRVIEAAKSALPFEDTRDLDEQARGLVAERSARQIMTDAGNVAFDRADYDFLDVAGEFDSIHPSMTRIGRLNNNFGLHEVVPGLYQVRGFDLANAERDAAALRRGDRGDVRRAQLAALRARAGGRGDPGAP